MAEIEPGNDLLADLGAFLAEHEAELIEFRRDLHAHPELAHNEHRTTRQVALRLAAAGLRPVILPKGTGLLVDIGSEQVPYTERPVVALRADIDALPLTDAKDVPYRSTVDGGLPRLRARRAYHRPARGRHAARPAGRSAASWPAGSGRSSSRPRRSCRAAHWR